MKKIISFSLWGTDMKYWQGAVENFRLAPIIYPGWQCRVYVDEQSDKGLLNLIRDENCEIVFMKPENILSGLFWRFYAADDADVMISRDTDSRLSLREQHAVDIWLNSDKNFHIMRDHPQHKTPILGGMWGCRYMEGMIKLIKQFPVEHQNFYGCDQYFLAKFIYPQIKEYACIHDSYNLFGDSVDFTTPREGNDFVGKVFYV